MKILFFAGDKNTKICGGARIECYTNAERMLLTNKSAKSFRDACNCLPECTKIEYNADIDRVKYDWTAVKSIFDINVLEGG